MSIGYIFYKNEQRICFFPQTQFRNITEYNKDMLFKRTAEGYASRILPATFKLITLISNSWSSILL
jgi:hypothetical protein